MTDAAPTFLSRVATLRTRRVAFWCFAALLFTLTHWPRLELPDIGFERPDLLAHFGVFGTWTFLLLAAEYFGPPRGTRPYLKAWVVGVLYAGFDEGLQAFPLIHRTAAWDDYGFNCIGVTLGALAMLGLVRATRARRGTLEAARRSPDVPAVPDVE